MNLKPPLLAFLLTVPLVLLARTDRAEVIALPVAPTADQTTATKLVYGLLSDSRYAYRPRALDDALSADMYTRYLESLDPGKQFFNAQDIASFEPLKEQLDEAIKRGDLAPAYAMFATYRARVDARVAYARGLLKQDLFDFTGNDTFLYNREDVAWSSDEAVLDKVWKK